jgi:hypothetical protein
MQVAELGRRRHFRVGNTEGVCCSCGVPPPPQRAQRRISAGIKSYVDNRCDSRCVLCPVTLCLLFTTIPLLACLSCACFQPWHCPSASCSWPALSPCETAVHVTRPKCESGVSTLEAEDHNRDHSHISAITNAFPRTVGEVIVGACYYFCLLLQRGQ